jgi:hypothetical protein
MDELMMIVRSAVDTVLDFALLPAENERAPAADFEAHTRVLVLLGHDHGDGRSCVDLLLRLLGSGGASEKRISTLPVVNLAAAKTDPRDAYTDPTLVFDQDTCSICLDSYEKNKTVRVLTCHHVYHASCVDQWLRRRATCPVSP